MTEGEFRELVQRSLAALNSVVEQAIRNQLARRCRPDLEAPVFSLVCSGRYGIRLLEEEEPILSGDKLFLGPGSCYHQAYKAEKFDPHAEVGRELFPWLADRWAAVEGPGRFGAAFAVYEDQVAHGHKPWEPWYDLAQRRWDWRKAPPGAGQRSGDIPF